MKTPYCFPLTQNLENNKQLFVLSNIARATCRWLVPPNGNAGNNSTQRWLTIILIGGGVRRRRRRRHHSDGEVNHPVFSPIPVPQPVAHSLQIGPRPSKKVRKRDSCHPNVSLSGSRPALHFNRHASRVRPHLHQERLTPRQRPVGLRRRGRGVARNGVGANHQEDIFVGGFSPQVETFRWEKRELEIWHENKVDFHIHSNFKLRTVARRHISPSFRDIYKGKGKDSFVTLTIKII